MGRDAPASRGGVGLGLLRLPLLLALAALALLPLPPAGGQPSGVVTKRVRVFLADFEDAPAPPGYTVDYFRQLFFGLGGPRRTPEGAPLQGSVREFFLGVSGGRLDVEGEVTDWVRLPGRIAQVPHWKGGMEPFGESWPVVIAETLRAAGLTGERCEERLRLPDGSLPDGLVFLNTDFGMGGVRREWGNLREVLGRMGLSRLWDPAWERLRMPLGSFSVTYWPQAPPTGKDGTLGVPIPAAEQRFFPLSVMMHEMGHLLADLPDLYGPAFEPWGVFDLMGGPAAWTHFPMSFSSYLRESSGWMRFTDLRPADHRGLVLRPLESHAEAFRLRMGPDASSESLILENRARLEYPPGMAGPPEDKGPRLVAYRLDPAGRRRQAYGDQAVGKVTTLVRRPERYGEVWGEPGFASLPTLGNPTTRNSLGELWWEVRNAAPRPDGSLTLDADFRAIDLVEGYTAATWTDAEGKRLTPGSLQPSGGGVMLRASGPSDGGGPELRLLLPASGSGSLEGTWTPPKGGPWRLYLTARLTAGGASLSVEYGGAPLMQVDLPPGEPRRMALDLPEGAGGVAVAVHGEGTGEVRLSDAWLVSLPPLARDLLAQPPGPRARVEPGARMADGRWYGPRVLVAPLEGAREWRRSWRVEVPGSGAVLHALVGLTAGAPANARARVDVTLRVAGKTVPLIRNVEVAVGDEAPAVLELPFPAEARGGAATLTLFARPAGNGGTTLAVPVLRVCREAEQEGGAAALETKEPLPKGSAEDAAGQAGETGDEPTPGALLSSPKPLRLTEVERERLMEALEPRHRQYDPQERMVGRPFSSPGYHTTLKGGTVHPTRDSLEYAVALLDTGDEALQLRAEAILRRVIALQDQDPRSPTYGIWSWFLEEPLDRMSPPDWNWADFCGVQLLQVALDHRNRLPEDLRREVDRAILHAARSIERRNVGPGYTNISIMGTYVTLVAAESYGIADLKQYALNRLRRLHEYNRDQGSFTEYNSPTYTLVALKELERLRQHARDPEARRRVEDLYRMAWEEIAHHFHAPTRQWTGPHSRCYQTLLPAGTLALLDRATGGRAGFGAKAVPGLDDHRLPLQCPEDLIPCFQRLERPVERVQTFVKGTNPVVGTTLLAPAFALGSVNRGNFWNQQRAVLAYWGSSEKPSSLHLRFLHDGYDFSAAQLFSVQRSAGLNGPRPNPVGDALAGVVFATDGGDTHVNLDRLKDATVRARDLRLRLEFGGAAGLMDVTAPRALSDPASLRFGDLRLSVSVPYARFGGAEGRWEAGRDSDQGTAHLDVVLYHGEERAFRLDQLQEAALGVALRFSTEDRPPPCVSRSLSDGRLALEWGDLALSLPVRPAKAGALSAAAHMSRGG